MSFEVELLDAAESGADFFAPVSTDAISSMVAQYDALRARIEQIAAVVSGEMASATSYFLKGNSDTNSRWAAPSIERLFDAGGAIAALNAAYWSKALQLTDVLDLMPQKRRDEWHASIRDQKTPDFTEETVRNTLADLIGMRAKFFAERVDGIFRSLSGEHVTNQPQGFGKRMIVARVLNDWGSADHSRAGLINDLRAVIAKFMGRDEPKHSSTEPVINRLKSQWGEWVDVDGGALRIRLYKKGTAHIEVHPDMAWRLNQILASLYPLAIPPEFRAKPKRRVREFQLIRKPLPFLVVGALASMEEATYVVPHKDRGDYRDSGFRRIPKTRAFKFGYTSKDAIPGAEAVLEAIGGVKQPGGHWQFDYEPGEVLSEIVVSGCIPDHRSHQFYPTPRRLAERLVALAGIEAHHTVLEPSAGLGGLADLLPKDRTQCVEISDLHAKVLEAKGHQVECADFLHWQAGSFNRVVMNPPFSEGRWHAHVEHAASMLRHKGRLVAILPSGAKTREGLLPGFTKEWHGPFDGEFAGTSVSVVMLVAEKC